MSLFYEDRKATLLSLIRIGKMTGASVEKELETLEQLEGEESKNN